MKVRVKHHRTVEGKITFTIDLPVRCQCGYHFIQRLQVGVNNPIITCPACYQRSYLRLTWQVRKDTLVDGDVVEVEQARCEVKRGEVNATVFPKGMGKITRETPGYLLLSRGHPFPPSGL
ncbi:hypothetical protein J7J59_07030 [Candidatus Aerophobetes bacterium]|nr:hypothetical protein [Candidatus Aerophobetes bacterium]